ncbi:MAG TPA: nitrite reductase small subunit NirD [Trebonia sp.]|nr:nitrite reductase small subunit NirD [Trebonia sp.]
MTAVDTRQPVGPHTADAAGWVPAPAGWVPVCRYEDLTPERGVCALVQGRQVAVFRLAEGELAAISNWDPFSRAGVLSRGIVGSRGSRPTVATPLHKQTFDLRSGRCLDDPDVEIAVHAVRHEQGLVWLSTATPGRQA